MRGLPREKKIRALIDRALILSKGLTESRRGQFVAFLDRVLSLLDTPSNGRNQTLLLISAALRYVQSAERLTIDGMLLTEWVSHREEAVLVHLRLMCAELVGLLSEAGEELRLVPVRVR